MVFMKKILALLLSVTMLLGILPQMAMAKETDGYYIKLEETDAKDRNAFGEVKTNDFFSGGQARSFGNKNAPGEDGYYIEFEVEIPNGSSKCKVMLWTSDLVPLCIADDCQF